MKHFSPPYKNISSIFKEIPIWKLCKNRNSLPCIRWEFFTLFIKRISLKSTCPYSKVLQKSLWLQVLSLFTIFLIHHMNVCVNSYFTLLILLDLSYKSHWKHFMRLLLFYYINYIGLNHKVDWKRFMILCIKPKWPWPMSSIP